MAEPVDLTFGEVGAEHIGMHLVIPLPAAPRSDAVLVGTRPCRGPEYVSLRCDAEPLGIPIKVAVAGLRSQPIRLYPGPIPTEEHRA